jgi:hypothetical protein
MIRMDWSRIRLIEAGCVLVVLAKEKMDRGRGYTELVIRKIKIEVLCPLCHVLLLKQRAEGLGTKDSPFCSDDGKPYAQSAQLSRLVKQLLVDAGIDRKYPAYSIRHAPITALFDAGLDESQVSAYTDHLPTLGSTCYLAPSLAYQHEVEDRGWGQRTNQCRCCHLETLRGFDLETRLCALPTCSAEEEKWKKGKNK